MRTFSLLDAIALASHFQRSTFRALYLFLFLAPLPGVYGQPPSPTGPLLPVYQDGLAAWEDLDFDGDPDAFLCGLDSAGMLGGGIYEMVGSSMTLLGGFQPKAVRTGCAALGDMDIDGDLDLVVLGDSGMNRPSLVVYRMDVGGFVRHATGLPGYSHGSLAWADLDGDGDLDIVCGGWSPLEGNRGHVLRNDGAVFVPLDWGEMGQSQVTSLCAGDIDGDGLVDVGWIWRPSPAIGRLELRRNKGGLDFAVMGHPLSGGAFGQLVMPIGTNGFDLVVTGLDGCGLGWLSWVGSGLQALSGLPPGVCLGAAMPVDMDQDGDRDLILAGEQGSSGVTRVYRNNGGTYQLVPTSLPELVHARFWVLDWNLDGYPDLHLQGFDGVGGQWQSVVLTYDVNLQTYRP